MREAVLLGGFVLACALCRANPAADSKPAASDVPGAEYPRDHQSQTDQRPRRADLDCRNQPGHFRFLRDQS